MNRLIPDVRIYFQSSTGAAQTQERIWLSDGTMPATTPGYYDSSFIPRDTWRRPDGWELEQIVLASSAPTWSKTVGIIQVPTAVVSLFDALDLGNTTSWDELAHKRRSGAYCDAVQGAVQYLSRHSIAPGKTVVSGLVLNQPGLPTVSYDPQSSRFIGLHLDSWDQLPIEQRDQATNRFVLNLGSEYRYFLFINLRAFTIYECMRYQGWGVSLSEVDYNAMVREFMMLCPRYPVVKVAVAPGEAYLAPTENIIHDATTLQKTRPDVHLTLRGYFHLT